VVAAARDPDGVAVRRHDPGPAERPAHATALLPLVAAALEAAGLDARELRRVGVGVGPGSFTGLRIGIATARGLSQAGGARLVEVGTPRVLAAGAAGEAGPDRDVLAVIDAGRGEGFALAFRGERARGEPAALGPEALAALAAELRSPLALGGGAVRFRAQLEAVGAAVPADESPLHRLDGRHLCRLAAGAETVERDAVLPRYVRAPDATPHPR
jgi:tRNA threonylcarbamoyladenosine biosynthesis protein TsaB